jgi:Uma2 family endonuclease
MAAGEAMTAEAVRHRFSVEDFYRMAEAGIFTEDDRVELIEGEVVEMPPIGPLHAGTVNILAGLLSRAVAERAVVAVQNPVRLEPDSEPLPDLAVLKYRPDGYSRSHPGPDDVLLVIEVADTTVAYDRGVKLPLYGRSGIREAWLVDLAAGKVEVYREPSPDGYRLIRISAPGESLSPLALPDISIDLGDVLGPAAG